MATGKDVLNTARNELGTKEQPANSNRVKYNTWYYGKEVSGNAYPWCMAFVQWCYAQAGAKLPFLTASCGALLRWYRANQPECVTDEPQPGDIVIFDLPGGSATDHTGLFESCDGQYIVTIDGNTGTTNDANGGAVMRRTRLRRYVAAYIHPREITPHQPARGADSSPSEGESKDKEDKPMEEKRYNTLDEIEKETPWAAPTVSKLIAKGLLNGTGAGLDLSMDMLRMFTVNDRAGLYGE